MINNFSRMTASADRRVIRKYKAWLVASILVCCSGVLDLNITLAESLKIEGRKLPWTAEFPGFWWGGTVESIERVLTRTTGADWADQTLKLLMRELLPEAKSLDAFFIHGDVTGMATKTVSSLRINATACIEQFSKESVRKAVWKSYGQNLAKDYPEGSKVALKGDRVTTTGGREAYEATFLITLPDGIMMYEVLHLITYDPGLMHVFLLKAESPKFRIRYVDLETILNSLQYWIRGRELPWRAVLPVGWLGGNEQFIETARAGAKNEGYRDLMTRMLREAKTLDAFLLHLDRSGGEAGAISSLRVDVGELNFDLADATQRKENWDALKKSLADRHPEGSKVVAMPERSARTGGRTAYETTFHVTLANGSKVHYVSHLVPYDAETSHIFLFETDSRAFDQRYSELQKILTSLEYAVI